MNPSDISWNGARQPHQAIGRDPDGHVWVGMRFHPKPETARERAVSERVEVFSRGGTPFVRLDWIRSEFSREIEQASKRIDMRRVIELTHMRDIGLSVLERQAP